MVAAVRLRSAAPGVRCVHGQVVQGLAQGARGRRPARQLTEILSCVQHGDQTGRLSGQADLGAHTPEGALAHVASQQRRRQGLQPLPNSASEFRTEYDGSCLQMRISYCPAAHFFLFLVQWTDCSLAGALGLLRILIYKVYADGTTTMSTHERKASIREFYAVIFPSLMQLHEGINEVEGKKQKAICIERYSRRGEDQKMVISEIDDSIEEECGICMEIINKVVLPTCSHAMCIKCYRDWRSRSQSCPFCRDSLKRVNSADLWIYTDNRDVVDMVMVRRENLRRLFMYIDKLPTVIPESVFDIYDSHVR